MYEVCENKKCNSKDSIRIDRTNGRIVCTKCGLVHAENIIADEDNYYDTYKTKRVGPPNSAWEENDPGNYMVIKEKGAKRRVKTFFKKNKVDKNFQKINQILTSANVSIYFIERTKALYKELSENKTIKGKKFNHIIIALYYYVCRKEKMHKNLKDIEKMFPSVTERQIQKAFKFIKSIIVEDKDEEDFVEVEKNYIENYIGGNISKYAIKILSYKIIDNINNNSLLEGRSPNTIAGLSLILSSKLLNDNIELSDNFFNTFSSKSITKKAFISLKPHLDKIIPNEYDNKIEELKKIQF